MFLREGKVFAHDLHIHIDFVGDADRGDFAAVVSQLLEPRRKIFVRRLARHVKAKDARMRLVVVGRVHGIEALLTGRVPNLSLHRLAVDLVGKKEPTREKARAGE